METTGGCESACQGPGGNPPLSALLSRAEAMFLHEFEQRLVDSEFGDVSLSHSANVLRFLDAGPRRASQFIDACGVSKQAVSQQISQLEKRGYIVALPDPQDQRARLLALTERGAAAEAFVRQVFVEVEDSWAERLGARDAASLRRVLERLIDVV
ncbi:MAG: MarR family winged helix-turn-helix transcriptional regulator [Marmoricola sp.]